MKKRDKAALLAQIEVGGGRGAGAWERDGSRVGQPEACILSIGRCTACTPWRNARANAWLRCALPPLLQNNLQAMSLGGPGAL